MRKSILKIGIICLLALTSVSIKPNYQFISIGSVAEAASNLPVPQNVLKQISEGQAIISWDVGDKQVTDYSYKVVVNGKQNSIVKNGYIQLSELESGKKYTVKIYTMKGNKKSKAVVIKFTAPKKKVTRTAKDKKAPSAVRSLKVESVSGNVIVISWKVPKENIKSLNSFKLTVNGSTYDTVKVYNDNSETYSYQFTNLEYNKTYKISVAALNEAGKGPTKTIKATVGESEEFKNASSFKSDSNTNTSTDNSEFEEPSNKDLVKESESKDSSKRISQVRNLAVGNSETDIALTWDVPERHSDKIANYKVYVNGDLVETTKNLSYTFYDAESTLR